MKNLLVIQMLFDKGWRANPAKFLDTSEYIKIDASNKKIIKGCISSVNKWANFNNYDYVLIKEKPTDNFYNDILQDSKYICYMWEILLNKAKNTNYNYYYFLAADMYVVNLNFKPILLDFGLTFTYNENIQAWLKYITNNSYANLWSDTILVASKEILINVATWMINSLKNIDRLPYFNSFNHVNKYYGINERLLSYYCETVIKPKCLPFNYNFVPSIHYLTEDSPKIIHFKGTDKTKELKYVNTTLRNSIKKCFI